MANLRLPFVALGGCLVTLTAVTANADDWLEDPITGCTIWADEADSLRETATWSGPCVDGKASGEGVLVWIKDGQVLGRYVGSIRAGRLHGRGVLHYRQPDSIEEMKADISDKSSDEGHVVYHYEGTLKAGELDGRGMLSYRSKRGFVRYEGEFKDGEIDGDVVVTRADGSREEARWENGRQIK